MDLVHDEDEDEEHEGQVANGRGETRRIPVRLRGRGGFSHPRGWGRRSSSSTHDASSSTAAAADTVDSLASSMSALQFVPHSVRMARGRGRGSGS
jgi:hypothetical protein